MPQRCDIPTVSCKITVGQGRGICITAITDGAIAWTPRWQHSAVSSQGKNKNGNQIHVSVTAFEKLDGWRLYKGQLTPALWPMFLISFSCTSPTKRTAPASSARRRTLIKPWLFAEWHVYIRRESWEKHGLSFTEVMQDTCLRKTVVWGRQISSKPSGNRISAQFWLASGQLGQRTALWQGTEEPQLIQGRNHRAQGTEMRLLRLRCRKLRKTDTNKFQYSKYCLLLFLIPLKQMVMCLHYPKQGEKDCEQWN